MRIKWLHLSDIHFNFRNYNSAILRRDFLERIRSLAESEEFTHLFLSGDVLHKNNATGGDTSKSVDFIRGLVDAMRISIENVIIVPGNHDHDRIATNNLVKDIYGDEEHCDEKIEALSCAQTEALLKAFSNYEAVYSTLFEKSYYNDYENPHTLITHNGLTIIRLNTAWLDVNSRDSGILRCGRKQLFELLESNERLLKQTITIAVGHHPIEDFSSDEQKHLLGLFHRFNIGIYLCGHRHKAAIDYYKTSDVLQLTCPGGYHDGYSLGGYVCGVIDTESQFYKAEFYKWDNDNWYIDSTLEGTDSKGVYYFNTLKYSHNGCFVAADLCALGPHVSMQDLAGSIGSDIVDVYSYPYSCLDVKEIDWDMHHAQIKDFAASIKRLSNAGKTVHLYPLAPIPLLFAMGFELQNNSNIVIHQRNRNTGKWVCGEKDEDIDCIIEERLEGYDTLVIKISCSFVVQEAQIHAVMPSKHFDLLDLKASKIAPGSPLYHADVTRIVHKLFERLNAIVTHYVKIHFFAAIPAGMAVEIGRNMLQSVYSNVVTYQLQQKTYVPAITLQPVVPLYTDKEKREKKNIFYVEEYNQDVIFVPILGDVACGSISEAVIEADEHLPLSSSILGSGEHYIIRASGDSMTGAGIDDGDLIIVRSQSTADDGQIIVAIDGDCTTLKRIFHDNKRKKIILRAENPAYSDQEFDAIDVQGVAVKVIKNLK